MGYAVDAMGNTNIFFNGAAIGDSPYSTFITNTSAVQGLRIGASGGVAQFFTGYLARDTIH